MKELKYVTLWKDGRLVFMKREDFERQKLLKKISKALKKLFMKII